MLAGRQAAYTLCMLRANAARKRRSHQARMYHAVRTARNVLQGWRMRCILSAGLQEGLTKVFRKVS